MVLLLLALGIASLRPRTRPNLALALFAGSFGMREVVISLVAYDAPDVFLYSFPAELFAFPALLGLAALLAAFPRPVARAERPLLLAAVGAWAGLQALTMWADFTTGWLSQLLLLEPGNAPALIVSRFAFKLNQTMFLLGLLVLAARYASVRGGLHPGDRRQMALFAAALVFVPFVWAGYQLGESNGLVHGYVALGCALAAAVAWLAAASRVEAPASRWARDVAWCGLAVALVGLGLMAYYDTATPLTDFEVNAAVRDGGYFGVARLLAVGVLAFGILRHQLFALDLQAKRVLRHATLAAAFVMVYLVGLAGGIVAGGDAATVLGLVAVVGLVALTSPLQGLAERVAERAFPGVDDSPAYLRRRRLEMYRAQLGLVLAANGRVPPREEARLLALRERLDLGPEEHEAALQALRGRNGGLQPGDVVGGRYRIERALGEGGMGRTYLAEHEGRPVVVKVLRPERARDEGLLREARALANVRHPQVVRVLAAEDGAQPFLAMEYVDGGSLADKLRSGPLEPAAFRRAALDLLDALGAVHAAGLVHRDVKPSNILLSSGGGAKLADFGVAHLPGAETTLGGEGRHPVGTVRYMSPEQARGKQVTSRSDLFSAAAALYEAWTGKPYLAPRPDESAMELQLRAAAQGPFRGAVQGPRALRAWFAKALDPDPARRFPSAGAMRRALEAALDGRL